MTEATQAQPGTPEYDAAMLAKAEGASVSEVEEGLAAPTPTDPEPAAPPADPSVEPEPKKLAGKYGSVEELETAYLEAQKLISQGKHKEGDKPPSLELEGETEGDPPADPSGDLESDPPADPPSAIDFERYSRSIAENGDLSEDDYNELQTKHNLPREVVDAYRAGLQAQASARTAAVHKAVGGEEEFAAVHKWASTELDATEVAAFNAQINAARTDAEVAVIYQTLQTRYRQANPAEPTLVTGQGNGGSMVTGYQSRPELTKALGDPRYNTDPVYRAEVDRKVAKTDWL